MTGLYLDLWLSEVKDLLCAPPTATLDITMTEFYNLSTKTDLSTSAAAVVFLVELALNITFAYI
jgi:hypothetical protein